jgi:hypothetical protein
MTAIGGRGNRFFTAVFRLILSFLMVDPTAKLEDQGLLALVRVGVWKCATGSVK